MADVEFRMDVRGLVRWIQTVDTRENPAAVELDRVAELILHEAKARAPVARKAVYTKGRRFYAAPGFLRDHLVIADTHRNEFGYIMRFIGTRTNRHGGAYPFPYAFIANPHGFTRNRGGRTIRSAVDYFLQEAEIATPFTVERAWLPFRL